MAAIMLNKANIRFAIRLLLLMLTASSLYPITARGQILEFDQNPPNIQWRQLHSRNFQLIYPSSFEQKAQQLSVELEEMLLLLDTHPVRSKKTPIILQNQSVLANGFVQLAPRRSEFVTTPSQRGNIRDWLGQLAIHELQHIVQFDQLVGQFKPPFFEQLGMALYALTLPAWYFEGDAVWTETHLTDGGRGRIPSWSMPYRANLLSGKKFSYQKDYLGSFRDVTPGFYEMGYFMVEKMYRDYGTDFATRIMSRMSGNLLRPYNFSRTLHKYTGYTTRQWHRKTANELTARWKALSNSTKHIDYTLLPLETSGKPENWLLPQSSSDGKLLALHYGAGIVPAIVKLDQHGQFIGRAIKIGPQTAPNFSYGRSRLVWDEIRRNPRYAKQTFNVINAYDLKTGQYRQLTHKTRLFSPVLHPADSIIASVEVGEDNTVGITLIDWDSGAIVGRTPLPQNGIMLHTPAFSANGRRLIMAATAKQGTSLLELDLDTEEYTQLLPWQQQQLERPVYWGDGLVLFKAHYEGIDNIYQLSTTDRSIQRVTHARFGAFNPFPDRQRGKLIFNNYAVDGYRISELEFNPTMHIDKAVVPAGTVLQPTKPASDELGSSPSVPPSRPYREFANLFNFHSLSVTPGDFSDLSDMQPGIYWLSDNLLNTLQTRLGYIYNSNLQSSEYRAGVTYRRYFPIFNLSFSNRENTGVAVAASEESEDSNADNSDPKTAGLFWRENNLNFQVHVPLVFYKRNRVYRLTGSIGTQFTQRYDLSVNSTPTHCDPTKEEVEKIHGSFVDEIRFPMRYTLSFSHLLRRSVLDLGPRWGQSMSLTFRHTPFGPVSGNGDTDNQHVALQTAIYLPGLMRYHSGSVQFNYQSGSGAYEWVNSIPLISGFPHLHPEPVKNTLLLNYRFPIAYPDWQIGALAYIKRIKAGFFADYQNVFDQPFATNGPRTLGVELRSDLNLLRFVLPNFDVGAKLIYVNNDRHARGRVLVSYGIGYSY